LSTDISELKKLKITKLYEQQARVHYYNRLYGRNCSNRRKQATTFTYPSCNGRNVRRPTAPFPFPLPGRTVGHDAGVRG